jgi:hypothetical protein
MLEPPNKSYPNSNAARDATEGAHIREVNGK